MPVGCEPRGYFTNAGYMGFVGDRYMLFASESDYLAYIRGR